jgi:hypothetical protein
MDRNIRDDESHYKLHLEDSSLNFNHSEYSVLLLGLSWQAGSSRGSFKVLDQRVGDSMPRMEA